MKLSFYLLIYHSDIFFDEMALKLMLNLKLRFLFSYNWKVEFFTIYQIHDLQVFPSSLWLPFNLLLFYCFEFYFIYFFIQKVLISHPFYIHQCIHVNLNHPIYHTTTPTAAFPPCCPYICSLHLCLNFCPADWFICTIFLGSTYMH